MYGTKDIHHNDYNLIQFVYVHNTSRLRWNLTPRGESIHIKGERGRILFTSSFIRFYSSYYHNKDPVDYTMS